jgi:multidrug transporter EmrE-like cation transporter
MPQAQYIPLILFTVLTNAAAQIMLKTGMLSVGAFSFESDQLAAAVQRTMVNPMVLLGMCTFVVSMSSHLLVLSRVDLSFAYPFLSLAYVVAALYACFVFHEDLNGVRILGIGLICAGTFFVARS